MGNAGNFDSIVAACRCIESSIVMQAMELSAFCSPIDIITLPQACGKVPARVQTSRTF
jgi:hypothetical protein